VADFFILPYTLNVFSFLLTKLHCLLFAVNGNPGFVVIANHFAFGLEFKGLIIESRRIGKMKVQDMDKCAPSSDWNVLYWVLGTVLMPVALPLAIINIWQRFQAQKFRNQLPGKVTSLT